MIDQDIPNDYQYEFAGVYYKIRWLAGRDRGFRWTNGEWVATSMPTHEIRTRSRMRLAAEKAPEKLSNFSDDEVPSFLGRATDEPDEPETAETKPVRNKTAKRKPSKQNPKAPTRLANGTPVIVSGIYIGTIEAADRLTSQPDNYFVRIDGVKRWVDAANVVELKPVTD